MSRPDISIIIPTKDRGLVLSTTLTEVLAATKEVNAEIIVINDSKVAQPSILEQEGIIRLINNPKSGVASARNLGASMAKADWLLFLDDDMLIFKENFDSFLKYIHTNEKICVNIEWEYPPPLVEKIKRIAFGRFLIKYGFTTMRGWYNNPDWKKNASVSVNSISSPNLFINKKYFFETGGYDENFPFAGFEDYAFSKRLNQSGFKMYIDTTSMMYHNEGDRINPKEWFLRKERGNKTRRIAVNLGFDEVKLNQSNSRKIFYSLYPVTEPLLYLSLALTLPFKILDPISFLFYKALLGISIYKGYNYDKK